MSLRQLLVIGILMACSALGVAETYQVRPLKDVAYYPQRSASATAVSLNRSVLSAQIQATVKQIKVGVAEQVKQGDLLVSLDCTDYQLALAQAQAGVKIAQARLTLAQSQKRRNDSLLDKQLTSQESADTTAADVTARSAELEQSKLNKQQAEIAVERCDIYAPFNGIVTQRLINEGQLATVTTPLLTLVQTDQLELSAQIKPQDVAQIEQAKTLYFDNGQHYPVRLLRKGGIVNSDTRNQEVRLDFVAQKPLPGSAGKLVWQDANPHIDPDYIVQKEGVLGVFVERNSQAEFVAIPGAIPGRPAPTQLDLMTPLIVDGLVNIKDGESL